MLQHAGDATAFKNDISTSKVLSNVLSCVILQYHPLVSLHSRPFHYIHKIITHTKIKFLDALASLAFKLSLSQ